MSKNVLGLDIGITSVGYGIIDVETGEIIDYGVRLFKESTASENKKRRGKRGLRRLISRKANRISDLKKVMCEYNLIGNDFKPVGNPYELRVRGLENKLTNEELATALLHIVKRRGSCLEMVEDDKAKAKDSETTKKILQENDDKLRNGKYICEIQLDHLLKGEKIRTTNNNFRTKDYVNEAIKILENQNVSTEFKDNVIQLIQRKRQYFEGPGSAKSPTQYGRYNDFNSEPIDLIEKMRGKCSIYPDEPRAAKMSYTACLFNLLNDMNNLIIKGEKITSEQKLEVIAKISKKGNCTAKELSKIVGSPLEEISGFRIDKNEKPLLTEFKGYKLIKKAMEIEDELSDFIFVDGVIEILTKTKGIEERKAEILKLNTNLTQIQLNNLASISGVQGYHSLSYKALKMINEEMLKTEMNQMQILQISGLLGAKKKRLKGKKRIEADSDAILSPVAKRAQREAMKVVNRLRELHGEFDTIVIETTRDKNKDDEKKRINESQKYYENLNKEVQEKVGDRHVNAKLREKVRLYLEQDAKTAYMMKPIDFNLLISDSTAYEVDHIIPISVSLDDSINNKVLVTHFENQAKGNLTPITAFNKGKFAGISKDLFVANVLHLRQMNGQKKFEKKKGYLLFDKDITRFDVMKDFINRNLVDTSYANRVVLNTLQDYFIANDIDTKIHTIKGSATSAFRKRIKMTKERDSKDVGYAHHAIDALIVASIKKLGAIDRIFKQYELPQIYDEETGEVFEIIDDNKFFDPKYLAFVKKLKELEVHVTKFSHKIDTKPNRAIADDTIYSTRLVDGKEKVVKKYKDIYDPKCFSIAEDMINGNDEKYLMYKHSPETYEFIRRIVMNYYDLFKSDSKKISMKKNKIKLGFNPLSLYKEEHGEIRKPSKKGNGPIITSMKYIDAELGNHVDISSNYPVNNKKVILLQISPYRTDFYYSEKKGYKFITIRHSNMRYSTSKDKYIINQDWYQKELDKKGITEEFNFVFSMHRDELITIYMKGEVYTGVPLWKFTATNDDKKNKIEVKPIGYYESKQLMPTISKKVVKLEKYATDVCGNLYKVTENKLKFEI